jgi:hypothetical protein
MGFPVSFFDVLCVWLDCLFTYINVSSRSNRFISVCFPVLMFLESLLSIYLFIFSSDCMGSLISCQIANLISVPDPWYFLCPIRTVGYINNKNVMKWVYSRIIPIKSTRIPKVEFLLIWSPIRILKLQIPSKNTFPKLCDISVSDI